MFLALLFAAGLYLALLVYQVDGKTYFCRDAALLLLGFAGLLGALIEGGFAPRGMGVGMLRGKDSTLVTKWVTIANLRLIPLRSYEITTIDWSPPTKTGYTAIPAHSVFILKPLPGWYAWAEILPPMLITWILLSSLYALKTITGTHLSEGV